MSELLIVAAVFVFVICPTIAIIRAVRRGEEIGDSNIIGYY
jgi:hypothetical protein